MKKLILTLSLMLLTAGAWAVPAKPGQWRTLQLADGTEVKAQLMGDEHVHYYVTEDGTRYVEQDGTYVVATDSQLRARQLNRTTAKSSARSRQMRRVSMGDKTHYLGEKRGLVILMYFPSTNFRSGNDSARYVRILNEEGYSVGSFKGSVYDYFKAQSGGQFELKFDVRGPYKAKNAVSFYGGNDSNGNDKNPDSLIVEAVKAAAPTVNFRDYDWDDDGEVDQVFILYAGKGEADGGAANTIWPHMYDLESTGKDLWIDGVRINTYACSNEVDANNQIEGIGCFCHEFSHCMGFPDLYDTMASGYGSSNFGMGDWDLMCQGSYNGETFQPAGYSIYEKWMSGWTEPIELDKEAVTVENLKPVSDGGEGYIIYNDGHRDEYYIVENRQKTGWDASLPGRGLMITHVDFDKDLWEQNTPNANVTQADVNSSEYLWKTNDHQRLTLIHADNKASLYDETNDLYPYGKKDSLTNTSTPKASLYNANTDGKKLMNKPILKITQNSDRTMSFEYPGKVGEGQQVQPVDTDGVLLKETFDQCAGVGGNDGNWKTNNFASKFVPDLEGWVANGDKAYGGSKCARFGTNSIVGELTSPLFKLNGDAVLTFRAAGWNTDGTMLELSLVAADGTEGAFTVDPASVTLESFAWTDFEVTLSGTGTAALKFTPVKRFILDDVNVVADQLPTAIRSIAHDDPARSLRIYTLDGRYMGTDDSVLPRGLYIIGGKKVVK